MGFLHDTDPHDPEVQEDIKEINELNAITENQKLTWRDLFSNGRDMNLWRFSVACGSQAMQQITGINLVSRLYETRRPYQSIRVNKLGYSPEVCF